MNLPKIPLGKGVEWIENWLTTYFGPIFDIIHAVIGGMVSGIDAALNFLPAMVLTLLIAALAYWIGKWRMALFAVVGLLLIDNLGLWGPSMQSLALVLTASLLAVVIGVPLGVLCAQSRTFQNIATPILDFMQTMPAVRISASSRVVLLAGCCSRRHCFYYICYSANDPVNEPGDSPGLTGAGGSGGCLRFNRRAKAVQAAIADRAPDHYGRD